MDRWHTYDDNQSARLTIRIQDEARRRGFEHEFSRVGWSTSVGVKCSDEQWDELLVSVQEGSRGSRD